MANDDAASTAEDTPVTIDVLANDSPGPADESAQTLDVVAVTQPANGTVVLNPDDTVTYVSDPLRRYRYLHLYRVRQRHTEPLQHRHGLGHGEPAESSTHC